MSENGYPFDGPLTLDQEEAEVVEKSPKAKVLLIGDDPGIEKLIRQRFSAPNGGSFELESVQLLSQGIERLRGRGIDAILLKLALPDSHGMQTFDEIAGQSGGFCEPGELSILAAHQPVARRTKPSRP